MKRGKRDRKRARQPEGPTGRREAACGNDPGWLAARAQSPQPHMDRRSVIQRYSPDNGKLGGSRSWSNRRQRRDFWKVYHGDRGALSSKRRVL